MPSLKTYDLFLSHAWKYNDDYYKLEQFLKAAPLFKWRNYSVPVHDPLINPKQPAGKQKLINLLDNQLRPVNCVIILCGMYAAHSDWISEEIRLANRYKKPIVGVRPQNQINVPRIIQDNANEIVGWNTNSIVTAIRNNSI